jgi:hypothetical protein
MGKSCELSRIDSWVEGADEGRAETEHRGWDRFSASSTVWTSRIRIDPVDNALTKIH